MMAGAISNIAMNIVFIPKMGAQGAAIATFISYALVFILRALGTRKFINISVSPLFMLVNVGLMAVLSLVMIYEVKHWIIISVVMTAVIIAYNFVPLFSFVKSILRSLLKRRRRV